MPAQSGDPVTAALQHSIGLAKKIKLSSETVDCKIVTNLKRILTTEIKYLKTPSVGNPSLADLKSKYIVLSPSITSSSTPSSGSPHVSNSSSSSGGLNSSSSLGGPSTPLSTSSTCSSSTSITPTSSSAGSLPSPGTSLARISPVKESRSGCDQKEPSVPTPKRILYPADSIQLGWKGNVPIGAGFINLRNTCYLNSTLQALFHAPAFVNWLSSDAAHFSKCESMNGLTHSECLICAMAKTLQASHKSSGNAIKPLNIYSKLEAICKHLVHGHQEDAHEFLRYLIEGMERSYLTIFNGIKLDNYSKETTPLNQIFGGYMRTEVLCLECKHISTTFQHFQDILLDIRQASNIEEALDSYFSRERLGDGDQAYKCEQCKRRVAATKKFSIERIPKVLCIQLKRFGAMGGKNNRHIALKQFIDISKYRHRPQIGQSCRYKLVSLVTHLGQSASYGHYTAVGQGSSGSYYLFDDSIVRPLSLQNVLNTNAYIVMYELDMQASAKENSSQSNKLVVESSNLSNGLSNGISPQSSKSLNGLSTSPFSSAIAKQENQVSRTTFERQSPTKFGVTTVKTATLTSNSTPSPVKTPVNKVNSQPPTPSKFLLSVTSTPVAKQPNSQSSPTENSSSQLSPQPSTSKVKSPHYSRKGAESLVPYLSESSDSDSAEVGSPPKFIGPLRPPGMAKQIEVSSPSQQNSPQRKNSHKERDVKIRTNGWPSKDSDKSSPTWQPSQSPRSDEKSTSLSSPVKVEIVDRGWEVTPVRNEIHSPAGSVSSNGHWSVTSTEKEKSPDRQNDKSSDSRDKSDRSWDANKNNSTVETLQKMSHRGFGTTGINSWNGSRSEVEQEVEAERMSLKRSHSNSYDSDLDRGKIKKLKSYNEHGYNSDRSNKFQDFQNRKNWSNNSSRQKFYRQYTNDRSKGSSSYYRNNHYNNKRWH